MKYYLTVPPESFQSYLDEVLERISSSGKTVYIIGDFKISLLNVETLKFTKRFLLSPQSNSELTIIRLLLSIIFLLIMDILFQTVIIIHNFA